MVVELDERIRQELLDFYDRKLKAGELLVGAELEKYYATFRQKWGPESLLEMDGEELLNAMHGPSKESMAYWLEFKDDEEFPAGFGSIAGGSSFKFGLFRKKNTGAWTTGSAQNQIALTLDQAIEKARQHRDQLVAGCKLLEDFPEDGEDEDYELLQMEMDHVAPDVSDTAWGHKYFSLLYPDKLDDYHATIYQHFHLIRLLQLPPRTEGRYVAGGRYIGIARNLNMAVNTLSKLLNERNGDPHEYWRIDVRGSKDEQAHWAEMQADNICSIGFIDTNLSSISGDNAGRGQLYLLLQAAKIKGSTQQVFDFRWNIHPGDLILATEGRIVLGVGLVTGDYFYDPTRKFPHCRQVTWLSRIPWQLEAGEKQITVSRSLRDINIVEAEKHVLNAKYGTPETGIEETLKQLRSAQDGNSSQEEALDSTWLEAIARVLAEAGEPLRAKDIAERAIALGMQTRGKMPGNIVNRILNQNRHMFKRVDRGLYGLITEEQEEKPDGEQPDEASEEIAIFEDQKLPAVPEPRLAKLLVELRRHLLVEEGLVRRIYHALLNGHVILAGPPGTGKTELARLIPEILWCGEESILQGEDGAQATQWHTRTAYASTLVTATSEWTSRTLISSIVPLLNGGRIAYRTRHGHLTEAILHNWSVTEHSAAHWQFHGRRSVLAPSALNQELTSEYRGHWLIIDEFNRAPIDVALGEALTSLGNGEALLVPIDGTMIRVPLPQDFRIIGTLNSFDRNYLNQISEALKRRFAFIEVLPPTRVVRSEEQGMVLFKALKHLAHLSPETITLTATRASWQDVVTISANDEGIYESFWYGSHPLFKLFHEVAWPLLEILRVYRQLGTAQAISLIRQWFTPGLLQHHTSEQQWLEALDIALCDTIADQLQVLLPDQLDVLSWYLKYDADGFIARYNHFLASLAGKPRRLTAHLEALRNCVSPAGEHLLSDEEIEDLLIQDEPSVAPEILREIFHLEHPATALPQFARRLRLYKAEHGL